jgi:cytochrome P450
MGSHNFQGRCKEELLRTIRDLRLNEQNDGPTELQSSIRTLGTHFGFKSFATLARRLSPSYKYEEWKCTRELRNILMPRIREQIGVEQSTTKKTVIQLAMKEYEDESRGSKRSNVGAEFTEDVLGLTKQFLFAGHDTTATTITWCFQYLSKHPKILERMRAEHDEVFGTDTKSVADTLQASPQLLNALPFTLAVAKEVLRMCPIAATLRKGEPSLFFTARDGTQLPTDGFGMITGTGAIHYHPDLWPRVNEFVPERWMVPQGDPLYPSKPGQWRPFEFGPMNCIGQELAMIELRMVLLFTVRELDIEPAWNEWDASA